MPEQQVYEYALIRWVPRVEREEFMNIGAILFCKRKRFLDMKYQLDEKRLRAFSAEVDLEELQGYLHSWELICQGDPQGGRIAQLEAAERFRWLTSARSTIIQSSSVHPGLCDHPEDVLNRLFERYVL